MKHYFLLASLIITLSSCSKEKRKSEKIEKLYNEIIELSESKSCSDPDEWKYSSYGSKACGGPEGYVPYSSEIDTTNFLNKIEEHRQLQEEYNQEFGVVSPCDIISPPTGISCVNGKATLIYD